MLKKIWNLILFGKYRNHSFCINSSYGSKEWYLNGRLHCEDGPAVEYANGSKMWYQNGRLHREDGPAIEWSDGSKEWWFNGERHREDGPAVERINGRKDWWVRGQFQYNFDRVFFGTKKQKPQPQKPNWKKQGF